MKLFGVVVYVITALIIFIVLAPLAFLGAIAEGMICGAGREIKKCWEVWGDVIPDEIDEVKRRYARAKR